MIIQILNPDSDSFLKLTNTVNKFSCLLNKNITKEKIYYLFFSSIFFLGGNLANITLFCCCFDAWFTFGVVTDPLVGFTVLFIVGLMVGAVTGVLGVVGGDVLSWLNT